VGVGAYHGANGRRGNGPHGGAHVRGAMLAVGGYPPILFIVRPITSILIIVIVEAIVRRSRREDLS